MKMFTLFKSKQSEKWPPITNNIGTFLFQDRDGEKKYEGKVDTEINAGIEIVLPVNTYEISKYQTEYFEKIELNWHSILSQMKSKNTEIDFENYTIVTMMIPDVGNEFYDVDAEIVLRKNHEMVSVILSDLNVDEIIII